MRTLSLLIPCVLVIYTSAACIPGGYCPMENDVLQNNAMVHKMAQFALTAYESKSNALCDSKFSVTNAKTQIVSGVNYKMTVKATCGGQSTVCQFEVFDQSWTSTRELISDNCTTGHRPMVGEKTPADTSSDQFRDAMKYVASQVDAQSNSLFRSTPLHFSHCFQQVVAGMRYVCDVTFGENSCIKGDTTDLSLCSVNSKGLASTWHVEIVSQSFMSTKYTLQQLTFKQEAVVDQQDLKNLKMKVLKEKLGLTLKNDATQKIMEARSYIGKNKQKFGRKMGDLKMPLLGNDGHDMQPHGKSNLLGGDGHDLKPHVKPNLIGGDGHDMKPHGKPNLIGGDGHDLKPHGKSLPMDGGEFGLLLNGRPMFDGGVARLCQWGVFQQFQERFKRLYGSKEEEKNRFKIFCENMKKAQKLQDIEKGTAVYGITKFADMSESEFKQYVGKIWDQNANKGMKKAAIPDIKSLPKSFDWREHGAVTEVKNQGSCGSCWAFSTTGNIEGQWAIKKKKLVSLSEQELVDCDKVDEGCNGGLPSQAYKEIIRLGGLESETDYKYKAHGEKCAFNKAEVRVKINGSVSISSNETEMAAWLTKNGPISIGINAFAMQFYMGGISHPWKIFCNPKKLDHGVLIVGYGVDKGKPYWIVKNSWGPDWGEKGYYLVYRGAGVCGLNTMCTSAVVN